MFSKSKEENHLNSINGKRQRIETISTRQCFLFASKTSQRKINNLGTCWRVTFSLYFESSDPLNGYLKRISTARDQLPLCTEYVVCKRPLNKYIVLTIGLQAVLAGAIKSTWLLHLVNNGDCVRHARHVSSKQNHLITINYFFLIIHTKFLDARAEIRGK